MAALANSKTQYVSSALFAAIAAWPSNTAVAAGRLCNNTANTPALGSERAYVAIIAGTTTNGSQPAMGTGKGSITVDNGVTWMECTGQPGINGDTTNSPVWPTSSTVTLGQIIYDPTSGSLQIVTTASGNTSASKPTFSASAGVTTTDGSNVWTSLGLASNFGAGAAPHIRVLNADNASWQTNATANTIFIDKNHAETQAAAMALAGGTGTVAAPNQYLSIAMTGAMPPTSVTAGASITTTGNNAISLTVSGFWAGVALSSGSGANAVALNIGTQSSFNVINSIIMEGCTLAVGGTTGGNITLANVDSASATNAFINLKNCTYKAASTASKIEFQNGLINLVGGTYFATGSIPTTAFLTTVDTITNSSVRDADLSQVTGTLLSMAGSGGENVGGWFNMQNCKLGSGVAMSSGTLQSPADFTFRMHNCDSGSKNYRFYERNYLGVIQSETTIVDNTNPASDGTTPISWNIATTAFTSILQPYVTEYFPIAEWNGALGSPITATINIASNVALTNAQIWAEIEYLGNASFPIGSTINSRVTDVLTAGTALTTSTDSWGGSETSLQEIQLTFTPQMAGAIKCRIFVAIPSTTIYVSPRLLLGAVGSARQFLIPGMGYINEPPAGGGGGMLYIGGMSGGCDG